MVADVAGVGEGLCGSTATGALGVTVTGVVVDGLVVAVLVFTVWMTELKMAMMPPKTNSHANSV